MPLTDQEHDYSVKQPFDFGNPLHHFMWALSTAMAYRAMGLDLYQQYRPDWMAICFEQVDSVSHIFMKYAPPKMEGMDEKYYEKYKDVVNNHYIYQDEIIGDFLAAAGPDTVVIVNSDHGFKTGERRLKESEGTEIAKAHLWHEEQGMVILWGPAIAELEHSLDLAPGNPEGEYNLGVIFEGRQDYPAAITHYEKAVGLGPNLALAHNNLGNCYQKVGEIQKAIAEYRKTAEVDPKHVECHYNLGVLYQLIGRTEDAAREFDAAIAINPDFSRASAALGELCIQRADYDHAIAVFQGLLQKEPANPAYLFLYGKALAMKGDLGKARQSIGKAESLDPAGVADALKHDPALAKLIGPLPPGRP